MQNDDENDNEYVHTTDGQLDENKNKIPNLPVPQPSVPILAIHGSEDVEGLLVDTIS